MGLLGYELLNIQDDHTHQAKYCQEEEIELV